MNTHSTLFIFNAPLLVTFSILKCQILAWDRSGSSGEEIEKLERKEVGKDQGNIETLNA